VLFPFSYSSKTLPSIHRHEMVEPWIAHDMEGQQIADVRALIGTLISPNDFGSKDTCIKRFEDYRVSIDSMWQKKLHNKKPPIIGHLEK